MRLRRAQAVTRLAAIIAAGALLGGAVIYREPLAAWAGSSYAALTARLAALRPGSGAVSAPAAATPLVASGAIEATTLSISAVNAGRLQSVAVGQGDPVAGGQLIAELDPAIDESALVQMKANLSQAQTQLALLQAGAPPGDVQVARAALTQSKVVSSVAQSSWQLALSLVSAPGDLDVKLASAGPAVQVALEQLSAAQSAATAADLEAALWERTVKALEAGVDVQLPPTQGGGTIHVDSPQARLDAALLQWNLSSQRAWQAHAQTAIATAAVGTARQTLADLNARQAAPQGLQAQANAAEAGYRMAATAVTAAQAGLDLILAGARPEEMAVAQAAVSQAERAVAAQQVRLAQDRVVSPQDGTVTEVVLRPGEVAAAGSPIVRLADLSQVTLQVYVPEPELGQVQIGQSVQVAVDAYPGRLFAGAISLIGEQAEFTPKNVQTRQDRANTVFAVKVSLENPDRLLAPGMPADAYFCAPGASACGPAAAAPTPGQPAGALATLSAAVSRLLQGQPAAAPGPAPAPASSGPLQASGTILGSETIVSAELGGRALAGAASEGETVSAGQVLIRLEDSEMEARARQAAAGVETARADLARAGAAPQPERVALARTQVEQAQAAVDGARLALADARRQRENPQDLDTQIGSARAQLQSVTAQIDLARANLRQAQVLQESLPEGVGSDQDKTRRSIYSQQVLAAEATLRAAQAQQSGAQATLQRLQDLRAHPVALDAAVQKAGDQVSLALAALEVARARLGQAQAPAQPETVAVAQARVDVAAAAQAQVGTLLGRLTIKSPVSGSVTALMIHAGEVAQPGAQLMTLMEQGPARLQIYVPASSMGRVRLGQGALVQVDAYPGRQFAGVVTHISNQAEFTPKNVATQEERAKTVFAVEIALENADGSLKAGMPADAALQ